MRKGKSTVVIALAIIMAILLSYSIINENLLAGDEDLDPPISTQSTESLAGEEDFDQMPLSISPREVLAGDEDIEPPVS